MRDFVENSLVGAGVTGLGLAALVGFTGLILLGGVFGGIIFLLGWNLGVVGVVAALGGSVAKIGYWTAFGAALVVGLIRRTLSTLSSSTTQTVHKEV